MNNKIKNALLTVTFALGLMSQTAKAQYIGLDGSLEHLRNSDSSSASTLLSVGTYFSVGSFGSKTADEVNDLLSSATDAASFGSLLQNNYKAAFLGITTLPGSASGNNVNNYFQLGNIGSFTSSDNIYAVFAQAAGGGNYRMGIFAAASYNGSGVAGNQIRFDLGELGSNVLNLTTDYADTTSGGPGAIAVGSGSLGGRSENGFYLGTAVSSAVPEPSAMSLMLLGGTALVALRRLRKNV